MSKFEIKTSELEKAKRMLDTINGNLSNILTKADRENSKMSVYKGYGIDRMHDIIQANLLQLNGAVGDIAALSEGIAMINETVLSNEESAYNILNNTNNSEENESDEETLTITNADWAKIIKQFKYYSTRNDATARFYEWLLKFYGLGKDTTFTRAEYDAIKNTFNMLIHKDDHAAYVYSSTDAYTADFDFDTSIWSGASLSADATGHKYEYAYACDGDTATFTIELNSANLNIDLDWGIITAKLKDLDLSNMTSSEISDSLYDLGLSGSAGITACKITATTTKKINDSDSFYIETTITIGEVGVEASLFDVSNSITDGVEISGPTLKVDASLAKIETAYGIITNYAKTGIKAGLNAGVSVGLDSNELNMGYASVGFDADDGWGYYTWL